MATRIFGRCFTGNPSSNRFPAWGVFRDRKHTAGPLLRLSPCFDLNLFSPMLFCGRGLFIASLASACGNLSLLNTLSPLSPGTSCSYCFLLYFFLTLRDRCGLPPEMVWSDFQKSLSPIPQIPFGYDIIVHHPISERGGTTSPPAFPAFLNQFIALAKQQVFQCAHFSVHSIANAWNTCEKYWHLFPLGATCFNIHQSWFLSNFFLAWFKTIIRAVFWRFSLSHTFLKSYELLLRYSVWGRALRASDFLIHSHVQWSAESGCYRVRWINLMRRIPQVPPKSHWLCDPFNFKYFFFRYLSCLTKC